MAIDKAVDSAQLEANLTSVADKIRAKAVITDKLEFPEGFNSALDEIVSVYEAPTQTKSVTITENGIYPIMPDKEYFAMDFVGLTVNCPSPDEALAEVESMLSNGYTDYSNYFYNKKSMTEIPYGIFKYHGNADDMQYICDTCSSLTNIPELDTTNTTSLRYAFRSCSKLVSMPILNTINCRDFVSMFYGCSNLATIGGINFTNATDVRNVFYNCPALENLTFNGVIKITVLSLSPCAKLTHDSLMSAINALYDWASEGSTETYTLVLGSTNLAKLTDAEKAIATQKGWTLA